jgi:glycosyltransferase involved in cell wall biosynthesis
LQELARNLGIQEAIELPGFVDNPFAYMRKADVYALSSNWEGLPSVLIEALAVGCNIVATDCPSGPREILDDGRYGRLVPVDDEVALAEAIRDALNDNSIDRSSLRERARAFSPSAVADRYLHLLLEEERGNPVGAHSPQP